MEDYLKRRVRALWQYRPTGRHDPELNEWETKFLSLRFREFDEPLDETRKECLNKIWTKVFGPVKKRDVPHQSGTSDSGRSG